VVGALSYSDIENIRKDIEGKIGRDVSLTAYGGRKKTIEKKGVIKSTYPSIFIVRIENGASGYTTMSFSYADIFTKAVKLKFSDNSTETA
jgi:uncharacterized protein Veg